jgi:hypothetical protein
MQRMKITGTINEIGNSTKAMPYSILFSKTSSHGVNYEGRFTLNNVKYLVTMFFAYNDNSLQVGFSTHYGMGVVDIGIGHALQVMATVVKMAKDFIKELKKQEFIVRFIAFDVAKDLTNYGTVSDKKGNQRLKLYTAFIKKALPGAGIHMTGNSKGSINIIVNIGVN